MIYTIFRNSLKLVDVKPDDSSQLSQKKQSEDIIRLTFTLVTFVDIQIGDYIVYPETEQIYYLNKKPRVVESSLNYQYECIFEGGIHELRKTKVLFEQAKSDGGTYQDYRFPLTGNAQSFLQFIVSNLNRTGSGYTAGKYKVTDTTTIQFNNWNVFEGITQIAETLGFSWYLDGKVLNFDEKGHDTAYTIQVGRKVGFLSLTRIRVESENIETVVYGYGSTSNLPPVTDYNGNLLTENRLKFSGINGESKLENNVGLYGRIESIQEFDDIKPERTGSITGLVSDDINSFFDTEIDFDVNEQLLEGITPKITFLSGKLLGLDFEINYDNSAKKITLIPITEESGGYPNDVQKPEIGDLYKMFDLKMPQSYITDAENRLEQATQSYLDSKSNSLEYYEAILDDEFIIENNISLYLGDLIRVISTVFGIDNLYEIKELTQQVTNPKKYTIKFGDVLPKSLIAQLMANNFVTKQTIYSIQNSTYNSSQVQNIVNTTIGEEIAWQSL